MNKQLKSIALNPMEENTVQIALISIRQIAVSNNSTLAVCCNVPQSNKAVR